MPVRFAGRIVVVTGGGRGIGRVYARSFAAEGAIVVVASRDADSVARTVEIITTEGGLAIAAPLDVTDDRAVRGVVERVVEERGGIDVLVNNAGLQLGRWNDGIGLDHDGWRRLLDVNVLGALVCAQQCRPAMAGRPGAVVVNQTSVAAGSAAFGAYGVSKLALDGLTRVLARDLAPDGIRVNALAPGVIVTEELEAEGDAAFVRKIVEERQLVHRRGSPTDLVETLFYLCSDASTFVTGQTVVVDGGYTVQ